MRNQAPLKMCLMFFYVYDDKERLFVICVFIEDMFYTLKVN